MPYEPVFAYEEAVVRLFRLVAVLLALATLAAFFARLLKPQPVLTDTEGEFGYVAPIPSDGPGVSVSDAVPLLPGPRAPSDENVDVG
jgi:hypothetical protein